MGPHENRWLNTSKTIHHFFFLDTIIDPLNDFKIFVGKSNEYLVLSVSFEHVNDLRKLQHCDGQKYLEHLQNDVS